MSVFAHELPNFKDLIEATAFEHNINDPSLVEKDYWIMHALYELQNIKLTIQLKGGTSLSKGFQIIHRFSEDIDVRIDPNESLVGFKVYLGKNQDDQKHRDSRKNYFDWMTTYLRETIHGFNDVIRDKHFDDIPKYRNGGIRLIYPSIYPLPDGLKNGILLEVGFDNISPNQPKTITSWALALAQSKSKTPVKDNRAVNVPCYEPPYTFVEKLQAIVRKYRQYKESKSTKSLPENFLRHYYDIYQLLELKDVQAFIKTPTYEAYKKERFKGDDPNTKESPALTLSDKSDKDLFEKEYKRTAALYYKGQPAFDDVLSRIKKYLPEL